MITLLSVQIIGKECFYRLVLIYASNLKIKKFVQNNSLFTVLTQNHVDYLNKATINTANYFVISNLSFTNEEKQYIIDRFNNPSSIRKPPFFDNSNY